MFQKLFANTVISAIAFVSTAVVSFGLVPLIVGRYGLTEFGLLMLARIMLPTGALAIFDFGFSEIATQTVARSREDGNWNRTGRDLAALAIVSASLGLAVAMGLALGAPWLIDFFKTPAPQRDGFYSILYVTAASFPILLIAMIFDGVVKGFEAFKHLRTIDICCSIAYGAATLAAIYCHFDYPWIAFLYIASLLLRAALLGIATAKYFRTHGMRLRGPDAAARAYVGRRCRLFAASRFLGASETQAAPFLIGALLGPVAVGIYDVSVRVPRFLKSVLSLMNNAVLPVSARLDTSGDLESLSRLGSVGVLAVAIVAFPVCVWGATFSEPILRIWLGSSYSYLWSWQSAMFLVPMLNAVASFGSIALLVRPHFVMRMNVLLLCQLVGQFAISLSLRHVFGGQAFVLGQVVAFVSVFPVQMIIIGREKSITWASLGRPALVLCGLLVMAALCIAIEAPSFIKNLFELCVSLAVWLAVSFGLIGWFVLDAAERHAVVQAAPVPKFLTVMFR